MPRNQARDQARDQFDLSRSGYGPEPTLHHTKGGEAMDSVIELHLRIYPERKWHITLSNPKSKSQQTFTTLEAFFQHLEHLCPPKQKGLR
jgi:hypothetical protein